MVNREKGQEINDKFDKTLAKISEKKDENIDKLEKELPFSEEPVAYMQKRMDLEASAFKKTTQVLQKEEEEFDNEVKKEQVYQNIKETYDRIRSE